MSAIRIVVAALALLGVAASPVAADHGYCRMEVSIQPR